MLAEPASALTDLVLGLVALAMAIRLGQVPLRTRHWRTAFWWTAIAALAGAVHHGFVAYSDRWRGPSWAVISLMVVITISYLLAASVDEVLGPNHGRAFWLLRSASLVAYVVLVALGYAGIGTILGCEGITMVAILGLWAIGARRGHPMARGIVAALVASMIAATLKAVPARFVTPIGLDPTSLYHLAQIAGLALLFVTLGGRLIPLTVRATIQAPTAD